MVPKIETYLYSTDSYKKCYLTKKNVICKGKSLSNTSLVSHGIVIDDEIWFIARKTLRKRSDTSKLHISYTYQWIVFR